MTFNPVCWDFSNNESVLFPLYLRNPEFANKEIFLDFKFDTGFNGTLGINDDVIKELQIRPNRVTLLSTTIGEKKVNYYQLLIQNSEWNLDETLVYAVKTSRLLIGRSIFKGKQLLLDFKNSKLCYLKEQ